MDCNTGDLRRLTEGFSVEKARRLGLIPVPDEHQAEADAELGNQDRVMVDMTQDTPLVNWAKSHKCKRVDRGKGARRQLARASRKANRRARF